MGQCEGAGGHPAATLGLWVPEQLNEASHHDGVMIERSPLSLIIWGRMIQASTVSLDRPVRAAARVCAHAGITAASFRRSSRSCECIACLTICPLETATRFASS